MIYVSLRDQRDSSGVEKREGFSFLGFDLEDQIIRFVDNGISGGFIEG